MAIEIRTTPNGATKSPESARLRFVQSFKVEKTFDDLSTINQRMRNRSVDKVKARLALDDAECALEQTEAQLLLSGVATGKNAEERKAQLVLAAASDPAVRAAREKVANLRAALAEIESDLTHDEWQAAAAKLRLNLVDATLRFLASEGR